MQPQHGVSKKQLLTLETLGAVDSRSEGWTLLTEWLVGTIGSDTSGGYGVARAVPANKQVNIQLLPRSANWYCATNKQVINRWLTLVS